MEIIIIAAIGENGAIGKDNKLLWKLSEDLKWFKKQTLNNVVVMGRKTFDSIGKALPNRENIVLTRKEDFVAEGVDVVHSKKELLSLINKKADKKIFIIGGSQLYKMFLSDCHKLYLTRVSANIEGDTYFPEVDYSEWHKFEERHKSRDDANEYDMVFEMYTKIDK